MSKNIAIAAGDQSVLIEMVGGKLPEWMQYRELLWNGFEAIHRGEGSGVVLVEPAGDGKVVVVDTGCGMARTDMVRWLNTTLTSGNTPTGPAKGANHGIGSKITARYANPAGLEYVTSKDGEVCGIRFARIGGKHVIDTSKADGRDGAWAASGDDLHPEIVAAGHGTQVTLHGGSPSARPARLLPSVFEAICERVWERPADVSVRFRFDGGDHELVGVGDRLLSLCEHSGTVPLSTAEAVWFTFPEGSTAGLHSGVLSGSEVYRPLSGQQAKTALTACGVSEGHQRVAVFFRCDPELFPPTLERDDLAPVGRNKSMASHLNGWYAEFRSALPDEVKSVIEDEVLRAADSLAEWDRATAAKYRSYYRTATSPTCRAKTSTSVSRPRPAATAAVAERDEYPQVRMRPAADMGEGFYGGLGVVYDSSAHTLFIDPTWGPTVALVQQLVAEFDADEAGELLIDAAVRAQITNVAIDAFKAARLVARSSGRGFATLVNNGMSVAVSMRVSLLPQIEDALRPRLGSLAKRRIAAARSAVDAATPR